LKSSTVISEGVGNSSFKSSINPKRKQINETRTNRKREREKECEIFFLLSLVFVWPL
jgi:hypothetical protein